MNPIKRLYAASDTRKTRVHDEMGTMASASRIARNFPRAIATGIGRIAFGARPERPWISYDAQAVLAAFLTHNSSVMEFGSGMSTAWYARRSKHVVSIEDDRAWHDLIAARLSALGNVDFKFAADRSEYVEMAPCRPFDLIMIDGSWRDDCSRFAVRHLQPGGMIYLDNCDMGPGHPTGDVPEASLILREFARQGGLRVREFTDFAPTQFFAQRGLMIGG